MDFIKLNKQRFNPSVFARGEEYYRTGRISKHEHGHNMIKAIIKGSATYTVTIRFADDGHISTSSCNCPYFGSSHLCKHVAATLFLFNDLAAADQIENGLCETIDFNTYLGNLNAYRVLGFSRYYEFATSQFIEQRANWTKSQQDAAIKEVLLIACRRSSYNIAQDAAMGGVKFVEDISSKDDIAANFTKAYSGIVDSMMAKSYFLVYAIRNPQLIPAIASLIKTSGLANASEFRTFLTEVGPKAVFDAFDVETLAYIAKDFFFVSREEQEEFVNIAIEKHADKALYSILESYRNGAYGNVATKILNYFKQSGDDYYYKEAMAKAISSHSLPFQSVVAYFRELSPEEKRSIFPSLKRSYAYSEESYVLDFIDSPQSFTLTDFTHLPLYALPMLEKEIKSKGQDFYEKALKKRLDKELKRIESYRDDYEDFVTICDIVRAFASSKDVLSTLADKRFMAASFRSKTNRKKYLEAATFLGCPSLIGVYPFGGQDVSR